MSLPTILLTGFEPFGGEAVNPSAQVVLALDGERIGEARIQALVLPCTFGASLVVLRAALQRWQPAVVLALGQAAGRTGFSVERIAINIDDARIPDNAGAQPIDAPVVPGGSAAYFSSLPIKAMVAALQRAGLPASVSQSAGTFVCNHVFYGLMHALQAHPGTRAGFMHLPLLPEQAVCEPELPSLPNLPLATQIDGVRCALAAAWAQRHGPDLPLGGGAIH